MDVDRKEDVDDKADHVQQEPWLPIETKLVAGSVVAGILTLIGLALLVHIFLLGGHQ